ncbi:hybrid sensor histidine kinase/response regulator [Sedimentitalea todarodis]|uniref:histidine kinase n=1 Tax=Sedimentitalea todarodis TaxID=1631240 RepID=A0ABU3VDF8_9RHOB|nr:ATP-binding protein [Sedimentitalea todarodis]MDU9004196.1 ATP-binding protein [Sedimentitalea todarodis]
MSSSTHGRLRAGLIFGIIAGLIALSIIAFLSIRVVRDLRLLEAASSDNMQWTVSQGEVEFLGMLVEVELARLDETSDLSGLRCRFDIFFSRLATLNEAPASSGLRSNETYRDALEEAQGFLDRTVPLIDGDDDTLRASLAAISADAQNIRLSLRQLSSTGLSQFSTTAEERRKEIAQTLTRLTVAAIGLIIALALSVAHLIRLNKQNALRQKSIERTAKRLNTIIATSLDAVIVCDAEGVILEFNRAAEVIFDRTLSDVIGENLLDVTCPPELRSGLLERLRRYRDGDNPRFVRRGRMQLEAVRRNGDRFPAEVAIQVAHTDDGHIFIIFLRDVSDQVRVETELVKARDQALAGERMKTDFLATMSHEIRTPLNGLLGNLALLRGTELSERQQRLARDMQTSGQLLMRHVSDVLDITRYDAGNLRIEHVPTHLDRLVTDLIDSQSGTAAAQNTTLSWRWIGEPMHWVESDPDRLLHILQNLIANAVKFTHNGHVSITAEAGRTDEGGHEVLFRVQDTGIGIAPELRATVFNDFVTGNTAYDREFGGTGLGLSIARRFATAMGGDIGLDEPDGQSTAFWVRIPVRPAVADTKSATSTQDGETTAQEAGLNILVVEDNEINRVVVCEMLRAAGHRTTVAHDGEAGIVLAAKLRFDLILMDISMPVMDGRAATCAIRAGGGASAESPIVAITANAMADEQAAFLQDGMDGVLTKPLSQESLAEITGRYSVSQASGETKVVDLDHRHQTQAVLGEEGYDKLVGTFIAEGEDLISQLSETGVLSCAEIERLCHQVAGSAAIFGATAMQENLRTIQAAAKAGDRAWIAMQLSALKRVWEDTRSTLRP